MSDRIYGPTDSWPSHDLPRWQDTLKIARANGWSLHKFDSHSFGMIACPTGQHTKAVDCTARNSEVKAKEARKAVEKTCQCTGGPAASATERKLSTANASLDTAETLLTLAELLCDDLQARHDAQHRLGELARLEDALAGASANLAGLQDAALTAALELEATPPPSGNPDTVLDQAKGHISDAESVAGTIRRKEPKEALGTAPTSVDSFR